jgi:hypothetical protein
MNWDYCTHVPLLYEATRMTCGDVIELGTGLCSTPLLHILVTHGEHPRNLLSVDDSEQWLGVLRSRQSNDHHQYLHVKDWEKNLVGLASEHHSVVFIDNGDIRKPIDAYKTRFEMLKLFANSADIIVIHDWENMKTYNRPEILDFIDFEFKYIFIDNHTTPQTIWLSNSVRPEFTMQRS